MTALSMAGERILHDAAGAPVAVWEIRRACTLSPDALEGRCAGLDVGYSNISADVIVHHVSGVALGSTRLRHHLDMKTAGTSTAAGCSRAIGSIGTTDGRHSQRHLSERS